ncbi:UNVERIFIED_CONTAM: hypothetical protein RMT77_003039 [Armadillidium vulgare]
MNGIILLFALLQLVLGLSFVTPSDDIILNDASREGKLLAVYTATSATVLATVTTTALATCFSFAAAGPLCNGRRRRRRKAFSDTPNSLENDYSEMDAVSGSLSDRYLSVTKKSPPLLRDDRKLTVWSTISTTLTVTDTSFVTGTTVSVSILCVVGDAANSCIG